MGSFLGLLHFLSNWHVSFQTVPEVNKNVYQIVEIFCVYQDNIKLFLIAAYICR